MTYVLVRRRNGRNGGHFEQFCDRNDTAARSAIEAAALAGTLDGHIPVLGEEYSYRPYFNKKNQDRLLCKLTVKR